MAYPPRKNVIAGNTASVYLSDALSPAPVRLEMADFKLSLSTLSLGPSPVATFRPRRFDESCYYTNTKPLSKVVEVASTRRMPLVNDFSTRGLISVLDSDVFL